MSAFLITGGSGFLGTHLTRLALRKGHKVIVFDQVAPEYGLGREDIEFFKGDIRDDSVLLEKLIRKAAHVVHLAGVLGTAETIANPNLSIEVNITASVRIFDILRRIPRPAVVPVNANYEWLNTYAITKDTAGRFALMYNKEFGTRIAVMRVFNAYGEWQKDKPVRKVVPEFIRRALFNEPIEIFGSGKQSCDLVYAGDVAQTLYNAVTMQHDAYKSVLEVGMGAMVTPLELARKILAITQSDSPVTFLPMRPGEPEVSVQCANLETLKPLGYKPSTTLDEGLSLTVDWYRQHLGVRQQKEV